MEREMFVASSEKYILTMDQGTTSSRCIIYDKEGNIVSMAQKEFTQIYPKPGFVEHDPMEIWSTQLGVAQEALYKINKTFEAISGIGITNQRETVVVWEKNTGKPISNAIVWQCRRTAEECRILREEGYEEMIREKTGLLLDSYFSATKIKWILDHVEGARARAEQGELLFGTIETWLIWNLSRGKIFVTDYSNASRTMLFNIKTLSWDDELLELFKIPKSMLAKPVPCSGVVGITDPIIFGGPIPICGFAGDQQAALFGQACFEKGEAKSTYGTGCFLLVNTGNQPVYSKHGLLTTVAWGLSGEVNYALEGSVFIAGAAVQWLRDELCILDRAADAEKMARAVSSSEGVYLVPAFVGLGAPYWNPEARGMLVGMSRGTGRNHLVRATLESIAFQAKDLLALMEQEAGVTLSELKVDGGACSNDFLMEFQADILNLKVNRPLSIETTSLGAAYLAGLATGFYQSKDEIRKKKKPGTIFLPKMTKEERNPLLDGWKRAVKAALYWAEDSQK